MDYNRMTATEFSKWCMINAFDVNKKLGELGFGLGFILLYKVLKSNQTKI